MSNIAAIPEMFILIYAKNLLILKLIFFPDQSS